MADTTVNGKWSRHCVRNSACWLGMNGCHLNMRDDGEELLKLAVECSQSGGRVCVG